MKAGHVLVGADGELVSMDAAFCAIMRSSVQAMAGRMVLDFTAAADREDCANAICNLRATGRPFEIVKRFQREDRSLVWVRNTVSISADNDSRGLIFATIEQVSVQPQRHPAALLDLAKHHIGQSRNRALICDPKLIAAPVWDIILEIYVAEAEGGTLDLARLTDVLDLPADVARRWLKLLLTERLIEVECSNLNPETAKSYRLTMATIDRLERFLVHDHRTPLELSEVRSAQG